MRTHPFTGKITSVDKNFEDNNPLDEPTMEQPGSGNQRYEPNNITDPLQEPQGGRFNQGYNFERQNMSSDPTLGDLGEQPTSGNSGDRSTHTPYTPASGKVSRARGGNGRLFAGVSGIALVIGGVGGFVGSKLANQTSTTTAAPIAAVTTAPAVSGQNSAAIQSSNGTANIQSILAKVEPAIVDISTTGYQSTGFFGGTSQFQAAGTGMIITSSGEVLTNAHVIANASSIKVTLLGKSTSYTATVIGSSTAHDVAVLQIHGATNLPTVTFGKSSQVQVGDSVVAIGNALALQGLPTVTQGIVSGLNRSLPTNTTTLNNLIQTDAPINPGNSGGPLVNASGQVIGMNTAIISSTGTEPAQNIGFAESIDSVLPIVAQIQAHPNTSSSLGTVSSRGYLGVAVQNLTAPLALQLGLPATTTGALVDQVTPGSPAANAGISPGSVITKVNSTPITSDAILVSVIQAQKAGDSVTVSWVDANGQNTATITLAAAPTA